MAAWFVYLSLKHWDQVQTDLLFAILLVFMAVRTWVSRPIGGKLTSEPNWSFRRTLAALSPLFVLALVAVGYVIESRQQAAEKALVRRKAAWRQSMELRHKAFELASKQLSDASRKRKEASEAWIKTRVKVNLPDGTLGFRHDPEASRKLKDAQDERDGAMERFMVEQDRLRRLQLEEPGWYGRP